MDNLDDNFKKIFETVFPGLKQENKPEEENPKTTKEEEKEHG